MQQTATSAPQNGDVAPAQAGTLGLRSSASRQAPLSGGPSRRFATRRRLFVAFSVLAALFVTAFLSQLGGLKRIGQQLGALEEHDEQMRLTLELEDAIRSEFSHQAHFIIGEDAHLAGYREARARAERLVTDLRERLDEPETLAWLAETAAANVELDRIFQEQIVPVVLSRESGAMLAHDKTYPLVNRIEHNLDRIFASLRGIVAKHHGEVKKYEETTLRFAIVFLVGTPLLALGIALLLSRSIARPLAILGEGASRVAAGDLDTRIEIATHDEFGALASKFNLMTAALKDDHRKLVEKQEELVRAEKLGTLGRVAAGIAHELNNPLQVILGHIALDKDRVRGEFAKHLATMEKEAARCKEIVEALLHLSRPAVAFVRVPVDLREVAEEVANALRVTLGDRLPSISIEGAGIALGTRSRLHQVVYNLARNAADASQRTGEVLIHVSASGPVVELAVSDTGPGVRPELRGQIFEPFFTTKPDGTGLGLSMARAIANALQGDIEVGDREGGGARFTLRVPRAPSGATSS